MCKSKGGGSRRESELVEVRSVLVWRTEGCGSEERGECVGMEGGKDCSVRVKRE